MAYLLPDYFLKSNSAVIADDTLFAAYSSRARNDNIEARLTTHCLIVLLEGTKKINFNGSRTELEAGEMVFLTQNNYFMSEIVPKSGEYKALLIYFNDTFVERFVKKHSIVTGEHRSHLPFFKMTFEGRDLFSMNIALLRHYMAKEEHALLVMKLEEILLNCMKDKRFSAFLNTIEATRSSRIQTILESNLDLIETVNDMCRLTNLSIGALRRRLLHDTGKTPKRWMEEKRLEKAKTLLENSDLNISAVAAECGYATPSWFIHRFKEHYGMTPKEIRQKT
jgi:AraC-like DNA-binding protein